MTNDPSVNLGYTKLSDVLTKKVGSVKKHTVGVVYLPEAWIGHEVIVVRKNKEAL